MRYPIALAASCGLAAPGAAQLTEPFPAVFELESLTLAGGGDGELGFVVGERCGHSVSSAGDVNGDGIEDVIIGGAPASSGVSQSWVIFGRSGGGFHAEVDPLALDGTDGFRLISDGGRSGFAVASAGDVNADGVDDLIIGAPSGDGCAYVVFGRDGGGFPAEIDLESLDGANGFRADGGWGTGWAVASAGDVNGDGVGDIIVGVSYDGLDSVRPGAYVVFGQREPFPAALRLADVGAGVPGFRMEASWASALTDRLGAAVASAGDINGDGIDDLIVGAPGVYDEYAMGYGCGCSGPGYAYVIFGRPSFPSFLDVTKLSGDDGFRLAGFGEAMAGASVSSAGDFNGDGTDDVIVGGPSGLGVVAEAFVILGRKAPGFPAVIDLVSLSGVDGVRLLGPYASAAGSSVAGADDVNGDGLDDVIVGSYGHGSFVVFGRRESLPSSIILTELDGIDGFRMLGAGGGGVLFDNGSGVAGAGDVNADGASDMVIASNSSRQGAFVVFGRHPDAPCYADCDGDGELTFFDFLCFQNLFAAGDPAADCDGSGSLDFFDFLCFQNAFAAGCP